MSDTSDDEQQQLDPQHLPNHINRSDVPALFWDELPSDDEDNPDAAAIKAILEETTPEESALNFKVRRYGAMTAS